jgi:hypothetical protein
MYVSHSTDHRPPPPSDGLSVAREDHCYLLMSGRRIPCHRRSKVSAFRRDHRGRHAMRSGMACHSIVIDDDGGGGREYALCPGTLTAQAKRAIVMNGWFHKIEIETTNQTTQPMLSSAIISPGRPFRAVITARNMCPMVSLGLSASENIARIELGEL